MNYVVFSTQLANARAAMDLAGINYKLTGAGEEWESFYAEMVKYVQFKLEGNLNEFHTKLLEFYGRLENV